MAVGQPFSCELAAPVRTAHSLFLTKSATRDDGVGNSELAHYRAACLAHSCRLPALAAAPFVPWIENLDSVNWHRHRLLPPTLHVENDALLQAFGFRGGYMGDLSEQSVLPPAYARVFLLYLDQPEVSGFF